MASTGTAVFSITTDDLVNSSLRKLRVLQDGQSASGSMLTDAVEALNILIKNAQSNGLQLWTYLLLPIPCVAGKITYTIGPTGADVISVRPLRLMIDGSYLRQTSGGQPLDMPLQVLSRTDYLYFGSKTSSGVVNSLYYHPGIDFGAVTSPSDGYGTLYVYVAPSDATRTVYANFQRPLYDMKTGTDEFDFPQEWFLYLVWKLAAELADEYEVPEERIKRVEQKALYYHQNLQDWSVEEAPFRFQPDPRMGVRW